ncbi:hypothetical protein [Dictyobacter arantiisoli]|uniref:DUF4199 domain-containing protein n=1 Tax=Dictyobacter arantiisoli TaxID=2014874 RepID=A0A5A5THI1_9CHLR|nr:hypothetical protein [Dictyobacter arantiisoli]GCF10827.1 hypothetical protein KDI_43910 [Dictyobacter arantiisoli]
MKERTIVRRRGSPALEQGIVFGILLGVIQVALRLLGRTVHDGNVLFAISVFGLVIVLFMYLAAGQRAAQETGRVGTGAFAGLWTGIISSLVAFLGSLLLAIAHLSVLRREAETIIQATTQNLHPPFSTTADQLLLRAIGIGGLNNLIISISVGLLLGAIGGIAGKAASNRRNQILQEQAYDSAPAAPKAG